MRKLTKALLLASGLALAGGAVATPALADADFRLGLGLGPPGYSGGYYYEPYRGGTYYYYHPHGRYHDYR